jgi:hypothetical protein
MSTINSSPASNVSYALDQVAGLLITLALVVVPALLLAISMDQVWPLCLVETTFILGAVIGAGDFLLARDSFECDGGKAFTVDRFVHNINGQSQPLLSAN